MWTKTSHNRERGLTLIELLIVVTILALLMLLAASAYKLQHQRALDARRKSDLAKLKVVFEDYYNDKHCYPTATMMGHCGLNDLQPYMDKVPCDPLTHLSYGYTYDTACTYYGLFTTLQDTSDPVIKEIGCYPRCAATVPYNYGITNSGKSLSFLAGNLLLGGATTFACSPSGQCNIYSDPIGNGCPITFPDANTCQQSCSVPGNRCAQ